MIAQTSVKSGSETELKTAIKNFVRDHLQESQGDIQAAAIGLPGVVSKDRLSCAITYLDPDHYISFGDLFEALNVGNGALLNDLECGAFGVRLLRGDELRGLSGPRLKPGFQADRFVLGMPGSGFGLGIYINSAGAVPSEGGLIAAMIDPGNELEQHICRYITGLLGSAGRNRTLLTYSDFVCGNAITSIFTAIVERNAQPSERCAIFAELAALTESQKPRAIEGWVSSPDHLASRYASEGFHYYGRFLGRAMQSASLVILPDAVYLGGSIAMATYPLFKIGFEESFRAHSTHTNYLSQIPVQVIMNPELNLNGATHRALLLATDISDSGNLEKFRSANLPEAETPNS